MSEFVTVRGTLFDARLNAAPPACYVLPEPLSDHGATKEIAKLSDAEGRWSLLLGVNSDYEITIKSFDDEQRELGNIRLRVDSDPIDDVSIVLANSL